MPGTYYVKQQKPAYLFRFLLFLIFIFSFQACENKEIVNEGKVEYDVTYSDAGLEGILPEVMTFKFKGERTSAQLLGFMGAVSLIMLSDHREKKVQQLVRIISDKYVTEYDSTSILSLYEDVPEVNIQYTSETKHIAGLECSKAIISYTDSDIPPFDVYYTDELNVSDPNWASPYHEIDGVLMEFKTVMYGVNVTLKASNVEGAVVSNDDFSVPAGYSRITPKEMRDKISGMIGSLSN